MTQTKPTIWLAMITEDENEYHIRFDGHNTIETAKNEIKEINNRLLLDKKLPLPYYVYEADAPLNGYDAYNLDDIDFNFYKEVKQISPEERKFKDEKVKELEKAVATGNKKIIEETAKKILEETKEGIK